MAWMETLSSVVTGITEFVSEYPYLTLAFMGLFIFLFGLWRYHEKEGFLYRRGGE